MEFIPLFDGDEPINMKDEKPKAKVFKTGGRGKKQCQNAECAVFVGVRNRVCPVCDTEFVKGGARVRKGLLPEKPIALTEKEEAAEIEAPKVKRTGTVIKTREPFDHVVLIPSGTCPIALKDIPFEKESLIDWAKSVRAWGLEHGDYLAGSAIIYYVRYTYSSLSKEYKIIRDIIEEWEKSSSP